MWKLQNLTLWKEVNKTIKHGKHFQMICQRVNNMIQPRQNFQFILGDDLEGRFQTYFYSEYPWIEYSVKEDALFGHAGASGEKEGLNFSIVLREYRNYLRSTMGHERLSSFALISIECDLSHPDSVDIENFIENFKLYSNKWRKILLYVKDLIDLAGNKFKLSP